MQSHDHSQRHFESSVSDGGGAPTTATASSEPLLTPGFPALGDVIKLVDEAYGLQRTEALTAHILAELPTIIERIRADLPSEFVRVSKQGYRRLELHHSVLHGYQIMAMVWGPGQGTAIHDHNDLWGVEAVVLGELQVARYRIRDVAGTALRLEPAELVELRSGDIETIDADQGLHLCRNPSNREVAVSLHVYRRPLDEFGIYVDDGDGWYGRREHFARTEASAA